jgi:5-methylthioadenosine/S-adenosylhomocysteine deaminase
MRAVLGEAILDFSTPSAETTEKTFEKLFFQLDKFKDSNLVKIALAPHAIYTCGQKNLEKVKKLAEEKKLLVHIHISETKKEVDDCFEKNGVSPVEYLDKIGLLNERTIAAHSVWLSDKDLDIYKKRGVKVSHCPLSNMKLASGVAVLPKMLEKEIVVGLGTDSAASNNTLDLFSDMQACAMLHKVSNLEPTLVSAKEVVKMATINGAKVLGLDKEVGSLEMGKKADIITIDLNKPHLLPIHNPYSHLVYCVNSGDVNDVIVDGKVLMKDRGVITIDEAEVLNKAKEFKI